MDRGIKQIEEEKIQLEIEADQAVEEEKKKAIKYLVDSGLAQDEFFENKEEVNQEDEVKQLDEPKLENEVSDDQLHVFFLCHILKKQHDIFDS